MWENIYWIVFILARQVGTQRELLSRYLLIFAEDSVKRLLNLHFIEPQLSIWSNRDIYRRKVQSHTHCSFTVTYAAERLRCSTLMPLLWCFFTALCYSLFFAYDCSQVIPPYKVCSLYKTSCVRVWRITYRCVAPQWLRTKVLCANTGSILEVSKSPENGTCL